jgi:hypothetical protein
MVTCFVPSPVMPNLVGCTSLSMLQFSANPKRSPLASRGNQLFQPLRSENSAVLFLSRLWQRALAKITGVGVCFSSLLAGHPNMSLNRTAKAAHATVHVLRTFLHGVALRFSCPLACRYASQTKFRSHSMIREASCPSFA